MVEEREDVVPPDQGAAELAISSNPIGTPGRSESISLVIACREAGPIGMGSALVCRYPGIHSRNVRR